MADIKKTVEILFTAVDKTGTGLREVNQNLQDVAAPVANLTKGLLLLETALLGVGVAFGVQAFNNAVKFEDALLDLQKVLGDGEGAAEDYIEQTEALAATYGVSATTILQGAAEIKQAGFTAAEAFKLQDTALQASVISDLSAAQATTVLIRALKGFKAPVEDAARLMDLFNETSNKNATNVTELANGFAQLSPLAAKVGLTYEETIGLITPIIEVFGSGAEAGNAMKIALTSLLTPTKAAKDELKNMGVSLVDTNGNLRAGKDIIFDTVAALSKMESTQQIASLAIVTTARQSARLSESLGNQVGVMKVIEGQNSATGSSQREFDIRIQASSKVIDKAKVSYEILSRTIGETFRGELTEVIAEVGNLSDVFTQLTKTGGFDALLNLIEPQLDKWKTLIAGIAEALPAALEKVDYTPIIDAFGNFGDTLEETFGEFDLTTAEGLSEAIQAIIDGLGTMINITDGIANAFLAIAGPIADVLKWFGSLDSSTQKLLGGVGALSIGITAISPILIAMAAGFSLLAIAGGPIAAFIGAISGSAIAINALITAATGLVGVGLINFFTDDKVAIEDRTKALKESVDAQQKFDAAQKTTKEVLAESTKEVDTWTEKLRSMSSLISDPEVTPKVLTEQWNLWNKAVASGSKTAEEGEEAIRFLAGGLDNMTFKVTDAKKATEDYVQAIRDRLKADQEVVASLIKEGAATEDINKAKAIATKTQLELNHTTQASVETTKEDTKAVAENKKEVEKQVQQLVKFKLGLEDIQSKERVSKFKISAEVDIAEIEANRDIILGAFESINVGIESTGTTLLGLFEQLGTASTVPFGTSTLMKEIAKESDLRKGEFELQEKLVLAQIELQEAKTSLLLDPTEPVITINGDGLQPELEAFMFAILETLQIRTNAEGAEFLLGLNPPTE